MGKDEFLMLGALVFGYIITFNDFHFRKLILDVSINIHHYIIFFFQSET